MGLKSQMFDGKDNEVIFVFIKSFTSNLLSAPKNIDLLKDATTITEDCGHEGVLFFFMIMS